MGFLDFLFTTRQKKEKIATQIGLDSGLFEMCPVCHGVTEARNQIGLQQKTHALVHNLVTENDPKVALFNADEADLNQTIAKVAKDLPYHCICETI